MHSNAHARWTSTVTLSLLYTESSASSIARSFYISSILLHSSCTRHSRASTGHMRPTPAQSIATHFPTTCSPTRLPTTNFVTTQATATPLVRRLKQEACC